MAKQKIGDNVLRLRQAAGWTQSELGERIGLSRSAIGQIERGEVDTSASTLQAIADEFGVPIGKVTGEAGEVALSDEARALAEWYDALTIVDRAFVQDFFRRMFGGAGPSRG